MLLFRPSKPLPAKPAGAKKARPKCLHPEWCDGKNHHYQERELCNACFMYERAKYKAELADIARMYKKINATKAG